jgi:hypothetical protein
LIYPDDMSDLKHANDVGYAKMAGVWFEGVASFLPVCDASPPIFLSDPVSSGQVGAEYRYSPSVVAKPETRFTLLTAPSGIQIHPDTGELRWTPSAPGQYPVDIQVQNSIGSSVQSVRISVP